MKTKIKLLIADSNPELIAQMKSFFDSKDSIDLVATATDGMDAAEKIRHFLRLICLKAMFFHLQKVLQRLYHRLYLYPRGKLLRPAG